MAYDVYFTPLTGHNDGDEYYVQAVKESSGYIWDGSELAEAPTYANTKIELTEVASMGVWALTSPTDLPAGVYMLVCRKQAGVAPLATDNVSGTKRIHKTATGRVLLL